MICVPAFQVFFNCLEGQRGHFRRYLKPESGQGHASISFAIAGLIVADRRGFCLPL